MTSPEIILEKANWERKIKNGEPFFARDMWECLSFLGKLHEYDWLVNVDKLSLKRPDDYFFEIAFYPGDPQLPEEQYDSLEIGYNRIRTEEEKLKEMQRPFNGCGYVPPLEPVEYFYIERRYEDEYVLMQHYNDGTTFSPLSGTPVHFEQGKKRIYDTRQNAELFGTGFMKNIWLSSEYTLRLNSLASTQN